ncbi:hypothetical protein SAMN02746065_11548 [Desulfocicer vacuolatum DSM 3385]|uniref:Outer-membrane lipoprotein LolB n=1 Tax=Desulfocicer vacuolatum DSM 3385 TaxID=1121400 RepID=A0A1W2D3X0_9BACT|nr:hypothetical protein [Desulfocicer vacuolatum]SMC92200.1 hypothetical protein SAMN02746065_11548 [Desulfocicer vacuolatum DSM 3385]
MKKGLKCTGKFMVLLLCLCLGTGCSFLDKKPAKDIKARHMATKVQDTNRDIVTSRGTGNLILTRNEKTEHYRMAWVAQWPLCLRMTLLSSGIPVETIAANGKSVTLVSHTGQHAPHTINRANPSLVKIISLPVRLGEIIALLTGKIPLRGSENVIWQRDGDTASTLIFKNWMGAPTEKIFLNKNRQVVDYWQLASGGPPAIKLHFDEFKSFNGYTIAGKTIFTDNRNRKLVLEITAFAPNISLKNKPQIFHLTESG